MKDFSQSGEQRIILNFFGYKFDSEGNPIIAPRQPMTVLDIGANDGILLSNSRALALLEWDCVLVEPAPEAFRKLHQAYNHSDPKTEDMVITLSRVSPSRSKQSITLVNAAITTQDGPIDFYDSGTHLKKGDTSLLSTTRPEEMARWKRSGEVFTKTTVRGITVKTLLEETGMTRADFISIDCEGVDLDVLRQLDLTALGTRLLCVEVNRADQRPFDEYCAGHGMRLLHRNYENAIYSK
jgi:FkbM family methyltransferase